MFGEALELTWVFFLLLTLFLPTTAYLTMNSANVCNASRFTSHSQEISRPSHISDVWRIFQKKHTILKNSFRIRHTRQWAKLSSHPTSLMLLLFLSISFHIIIFSRAAVAARDLCDFPIHRHQRITSQHIEYIAAANEEDNLFETTNQHNHSGRDWISSKSS